ncbi:MAG: efflux RND transporter permease subunit [Bradymonadia bacterium]
MTRFALINNRVTLVAVLVVLLGGFTTYQNMSRSMDPGFTIRTALVQTFFPGGSPQRVEELVTDRLEEVVMEIPELDFVNSNSKTGLSVMFVNLKETTPPEKVREVWDRLRRKINDVKPSLPDGVAGPFINDEFGDVFGIVVGMTGDGFTPAELEDVAEKSRKRLLRLPDVAKVQIFGVQEERIFIEYSNARLAEVGLSPGILQAVLASRNIVIPGGYVRIGPERIALEPSGNFESVDELKQTLIQTPGGGLVYLGDIADVRRGYVDPASDINRVNGNQGLSLAISMREGGNIITLGEQVKGAMEIMESIYPWGIEMEVTAFLPQAVEKKVGEFVENLLQAIGLVIVVMLLTLGLRTGLVVASLIPTAIIAAILMMGAVGEGLNQMSLAALIIALGLLVDNAIVMAESIMVRMESGMKPFDAAIDSAKELRIPLLTSSLTTAAAFLPIYLAESNVGEYTAALFVVVSITLMASWVLALTLIPLLSMWFIKVKPREAGGGPLFGSLGYRLYRAVLMPALRFKFVTVLLVIGVFLGSMQGFKIIPFIFFPPSDQTYSVIELELPQGTPIERTSEVAVEIEKLIAKKVVKQNEDGTWPDGVKVWNTFIGQGGPRFVLSFNPSPPADNYAIIIVDNATRPHVDTLNEEIADFVFETFPEAKVTAKPLANGPPTKAPVEFRIYADGNPALLDVVGQVKAKLATVPGVRNVSDDWGRWAKKFKVDIDQARARRAGLSSQDIAVSLQTSLTGLDTSQYREGTELIPITLRSELAERNDVTKVEGLNMFVQQTGRSVPLEQVGTVSAAWEPSIIRRRDRERVYTVQAFLDPGVTAVQINAIMAPWLEAHLKTQGPDFRFEVGGDVEASSKGNDSIGAKMPIALLLIILLLVAQFNSIRRPAIILLTIPLGMIGVVAGLIIARSYFGFMTLLGVVSLAGIVINNAIVLIERIKLEIEENGLSPDQAIIVACQRRIRPILLTTATTVGGLIPLWLGGGPMFEPMAVAILFGLIFATALTLGVVPVLYAVFFRVKYKGFQYQPVVD